MKVSVQAEKDWLAYSDLILPTVRAVIALGGSATAREVTSQVIEDLAPSEEMLAVSHEHRPEASVLMERIQWARSYAKLIGALESPKRGVFLVTPLGKELTALPSEEGQRRTLELDRRGAELLFQVLTEREEKNAIAIASRASLRESRARLSHVSRSVREYLRARVVLTWTR